jgi:hypothetical protein
LPPDGKVTTTARFSAPGTYVLRGIADDGYLFNFVDVTVNVRPNSASSNRWSRNLDVGSNTAEANRRMAERALQNIVLAEARAFGRMDLLNPEVVRTG